MKRLKLTVIFLGLFLLSIISSGQSYIVEGYVFLENQSLHGDIKVVFERQIPTYLIDSTYTDENGYFDIAIEQGIYDITYLKSNYIPVSIYDQPIYSNTILQDTTLELTGLSGQLSGVLYPDIYKVGGNIEVAYNDTLTIQPGVSLIFTQDLTFTINGLLNAVGTKDDSIIFTRYSNNITWGGIKFESESDDQSILSYCVIEYSNNSGVKTHLAFPTITNSTIKDNTSYFGGGIYCNSGSGMQGSTLTITNCIINNNSAIYGGGLGCTWSNMDVTNSIIVNNSATEFGGGFVLGYDVNVKIINSVISQNSSGIVFRFGGHPIIINTIISHNGKGIYNEGGGTYDQVYYSDVWGNSSGNFVNCGEWVGVNVTVNSNGDSIDPYGNIQSDPMFIDDTNNIFELSPGSPCIDAGLNDSVTIPFDFKNMIRIWDGNEDGDTIVDIGTYEYGAPVWLYIYDETKFDYEENIIVSLYPNPFTATTTLSYALEKPCNVTIFIYNSQGQQVVVIHQNQAMGEQRVPWKASGLPSGIYYYRIQAGEQVGSGKMVLLR